MTLILTSHHPHGRHLIGLLILYPLVGLYLFMERILYWPQAWLGVQFSTIAFFAINKWNFKILQELYLV